MAEVAALPGEPASAAVAVLPSAASVPPPVAPAWVWRVPAGDRPEFISAIDRDGAGGASGQIMYQAPNAVGLLVAVLTHAAINEGARNAEERRLQAAANVRVKRYRLITDSTSMTELQRLAVARSQTLPGVVIEGDALAGKGATMVDSRQVFVLSLDGKSLALEARVATGGQRLDDAGAAEATLVRVVSAPIGDISPEVHWLEDGGIRLKEAMAGLMAQMLDLGLATLPKSDNLPQKTIRFIDGGNEKAERGYLISQRCGRVVMRNLRGVLMSLPQRPDTDASGCDQTAASN